MQLYGSALRNKLPSLALTRLGSAQTSTESSVVNDTFLILDEEMGAIADLANIASESFRGCAFLVAHARALAFVRNPGDLKSH